MARLVVKTAIWISFFISLAFVAGSALEGFARPERATPAFAMPVRHTALRTWSIFIATLVLATLPNGKIRNDAEAQALRGNRIFVGIAVFINLLHLGLAITQLIVGNDNLDSIIVIGIISALSIDLVVLSYALYKLIR